MYKPSLLLLLSFFVLTLVSSKTYTLNLSDPKEAALYKTASYKLKLGDKVIIALSSPTKGYDWLYSKPHHTVHAFTDSQYVPDKTKEGSGTKYITVEG